MRCGFPHGQPFTQVEDKPFRRREGLERILHVAGDWGQSGRHVRRLQGVFHGVSAGNDTLIRQQVFGVSLDQLIRMIVEDDNPAGLFACVH